MKLQGHFGYRRILQYCFSPILMMIFTSIYGIVDGFFISNWAGSTAFAAVNLIMPFTFVLGSLGLMFGSGGCALVAKTLGEGEEKRANQYFSMILLVSVICSLILGVIGILFMKDIALLLGADASMLKDSVEYGRTILFFNIMYSTQFFFQPFFSAAGKPGLGFFITVAAGVANMILDWLFVAVFHWGTPGAAIATGIGQTIGSLIPLIYFASKKNTSTLHLHWAKIQPRIILLAASNGFSELMSNISQSIVGILYNLQLIRYFGANGVAAYGVLMYVGMIFIAVFFGYTMGVSPIISFNYGAGNKKELRSLLKKSLIINIVMGVIMCVSAYSLSNVLSNIFVGYDKELHDLTVYAFHIFALLFLGAGINVFTSAFFTALNNGLVSALISFMRSLVLQAVFVFLLPVLLGPDGIWWAVVAAELLGLFISAFFLLFENKKYHYLPKRKTA